MKRERDTISKMLVPISKIEGPSYFEGSSCNEEPAIPTSVPDRTITPMDMRAGDMTEILKAIEFSTTQKLNLENFIRPETAIFDISNGNTTSGKMR
mmetsp:Transcript_5919/g.9658  ORF Transcript_5919/g.9658 Transcript_5919/m.9658 type:complete len:96 (+) Transcript_5919:175-462(+)